MKSYNNNIHSFIYNKNCILRYPFKSYEPSVLIFKQVHPSLQNPNGYTKLDPKGKKRTILT
jgi:hypothetical protein